MDGLRAIAAISVLVSHAGFAAGYSQAGTLGTWTTNLNSGVTIFFVISGFLLYRPFVAAQLTGRSGPGLSRFYWRRLLRIVPAYWTALTVLAIASGDGGTFDHWPVHYLFLQPYQATAPGGLFQTWSLAVEVAFYLVLPLYAFVAGRVFEHSPVRRRVAGELWLLLGISLLSALANLTWLHGETSALVSGLPRYFFWFALGMAIAVVSAGRAHAAGLRPSRISGWIAVRPGALWLSAALLFLLLGAVSEQPADGITFTPNQQMLQWLLAGAIALLLVLPAAFRDPSAGSVPARVLSTRTARWLGLVSYGIFLWQVAPLRWMNEHEFLRAQSAGGRFFAYATVALVVTIPLAAASYYGIERPFLRLKDPRPSKPARTAKAEAPS